MRFIKQQYFWIVTLILYFFLLTINILSLFIPKNCHWSKLNSFNADQIALVIAIALLTSCLSLIIALFPFRKLNFINRFKLVFPIVMAIVLLYLVTLNGFLLYLKIK